MSRLQEIPGIGVDRVGDAADAAGDPEILRLENLDTDLRPPAVAIEVTHRASRTTMPTRTCPSGVPGATGGRRGARRQDLRGRVRPGDAGPQRRRRAERHHQRAARDRRARPGGGPGRPHLRRSGQPHPAGRWRPRHVRSHPTGAGWQTAPDELAAAVGPATAAVLLMGPAMPTGALLTREHLDAIAGPVREHDAWIVYDAAMERLRFDGRPPLRPASHPDLTDRVITVGSASKELRMIGWRVGWVTGPAGIVADIGLVGLTNVVCPVGIAQRAVAAALTAPGADGDVAAATAVWRERAEVVLDQLRDDPCAGPTATGRC